MRRSKNLEYAHHLARRIKQRWLTPLRQTRVRRDLLRWAETLLNAPCQVQELPNTARLTLRLISGGASCIAQYGKYPKRFRIFCRLGAHLHTQGVRVPGILNSDPERRFVLLEDIGAVSAQEALCGQGGAKDAAGLCPVRPRGNAEGDSPPAGRTVKEGAETILGQCIQTLADFHARGTRGLEAQCRIPVFDVDEWTANTLHRFGHALRTRRLRASPAILARAGDEFKRYRAAVFTEKEEEPRRVCHTDCHLGNFFLRDGEVYILDWEDSKLAPPAVDLAFFFISASRSVPEFRQYRGTGLALYLEASELPVEEHPGFVRQVEFFEAGLLLRRLARYMEKSRRGAGPDSLPPALRDLSRAVLQRGVLAPYPALTSIIASVHTA